VLIRENGRTTYFASDVAYHWNKMERGFKRIIDVLGADHHGYVTRITAVMKALGLDSSALQVPLIQFAILYRGGQRVQMSTRSGQFVTLKLLREEVGRDAARFFYIMRKSDQHMDFDLDLAKSKTNENPVYYIQYAHARICSIFRQLQEKQWSFDQSVGLKSLALLTTTPEEVVLTSLSQYPDIIKLAATKLEPHQLANYLRDLATAFHTCYNATPFLVDDLSLRSARLCLIEAVRQTIANGLALLGVSVPEQM
jgi:arginyl-tRNA synthetase